MMGANDSYSETNISLYTKENKRKTATGFFPLLKFKENLYNSCQTKFSKFLNRSGDIKLLINNKINEKIPLNDYIINSYNNLNESKLTPIPYINKRKLKNNIEKRELKNFQRNVVFMRRLEYTNKIKEKKIKKKYKDQVPQIITIQKIVRGYLVRKVIFQINIIKETLSNFFYSIRFCIIKKYYYIFIKNIENDNTDENGEENSKNCHMNICDENTAKNSIKNDYDFGDKNENKIKINKIIEPPKDLCYVEYDVTKKIFNNIKEEKSNDNNQYGVKIKNKYKFSSYKKKEKVESILENDEYIEFSSKKSNNKNIGILNQNNNKGNRNPANDLLNYQLSSLSSFKNLKRTKTQTIQRQFRKYLSKKGYYGRFDKRKIAIIYLIKYMIVNNIKSYILSVLKSLYKEFVEMKSTQEENYYNMSSERIRTLNKNYIAALTGFK